jgi:hypothetical protein
MEKQKSKRLRNIKFLGLTGLSLCALCCLLPIAGAFFGLGGLVTLSAKFESLAMILIALSAILLGIYFYRKSKHRKACSVDCNCNPATNKSI